MNPRIIHPALFACSGLLLLMSVVNLWDGYSAYSSKPLASSVPVIHLHPIHKDLVLLQRYPLFGHAIDDALPIALINAKIVGLMPAIPMVLSSAIISVNSEPDTIVHPGDCISGHYCIDAINQHGIVFKHNQTYSHLAYTQPQLHMGPKPQGLG